MTLENHDSAQKLYTEVLRTANHFLHNCKTFPVDLLKQEDPSYESVAKTAQMVAVIITSLSDDFDPMMGPKAVEYCQLMLQMGLAIKNEDQAELNRLVLELERRPGT